MYTVPRTHSQFATEHPAGLAALSIVQPHRTRAEGSRYRVAVIGRGNVGGGLADLWERTGHEVKRMKFRSGGSGGRGGRYRRTCGRCDGRFLGGLQAVFEKTAQLGEILGIAPDPAVVVNVVPPLDQFLTLRRLKVRVGIDGLPNRKLVNRTFLVAAIAHGLDSAILDPTDKKLFGALKASLMIAGKDEFCMEYIAEFREGRLE